MLKKLLKYDLKFVYKSVWVFYVLILFFSTLARVFAEVEQTTLILVLKGIARGAAISFMFSAVINNMFACWRRFNGHLYGDESYLTHTLPVTKKSIYSSHFFNAVVTMFSSILVSLLGCAVLFYSEENMEMLRAIMKGMAESYDSTPWQMILIFAVLIFTQMIFIIQSGYTGLVLGHKAESGKMGKSVIWGFVIYYVAQLVMLGIVYLVALFDSDVMKIFTDNTMESVSAFKTVLYVIGGMYVFFVLLYCVVDVKLLKKGVNVE